MTMKPFFKGRLIAIGGNEDKSSELVVLNRVVQEVNKPQVNVAVITTASEEPDQSFHTGDSTGYCSGRSG